MVVSLVVVVTMVVVLLLLVMVMVIVTVVLIVVDEGTLIQPILVLVCPWLGLPVVVVQPLDHGVAESRERADPHGLPQRLSPEAIFVSVAMVSMRVVTVVTEDDDDGDDSLVANPSCTPTP